jgi:hypothetical protein
MSSSNAAKKYPSRRSRGRQTAGCPCRPDDDAGHLESTCELHDLPQQIKRVAPHLGASGGDVHFDIWHAKCDDAKIPAGDQAAQHGALRSFFCGGQRWPGYIISSNSSKPSSARRTRQSAAEYAIA